MRIEGFSVALLHGLDTYLVDIGDSCLMAPYLMESLLLDTLVQVGPCTSLAIISVFLVLFLIITHQ